MTAKKITSSTLFIIIEFCFFYIFVPFIANEYLDGWLKIIPLLLIALIFLIFLLRDPNFNNKELYQLNRRHLKRSVARVIVITVLLVWFTFWIFPHLFFGYPMEDFTGYLLTFFLYPFASVLPQELVYRVYFFHRYKEIVPEKYLLMLSNAIIFGLTHWIYGNWVAPIGTFLVSWIFIFTYLKSRSLINVSLEHYFYGMVMFTIGFGYYFQ